MLCAARGGGFLFPLVGFFATKGSNMLWTTVLGQPISEASSLTFRHSSGQLLGEVPTPTGSSFLTLLRAGFRRSRCR